MESPRVNSEPRGDGDSRGDCHSGSSSHSCGTSHSRTASHSLSDRDFPPSPPMASTHLSAPPPLRFKPSLNDFVYKSEHFPVVAPDITPTSSALNITISLIATMLESEDNDAALAYMVDHQVVQRLFSPRQVLKDSDYVEAEYALRHQYSASAMAWYILDLGRDEGRCSACCNVQAQGPFEECVVPTDRRAEGACTNCFFMGRSVHCPHRIARKQSTRVQVEPSIESACEAYLREFTDHKLSVWEARLENELRLREEKAQAKLPRGRKGV